MASPNVSLATSLANDLTKGNLTKGPWYRSLRWRIQAWYALLLLLSLIGFGSLLQFEMNRAFWSDVDEELLNAARSIENAMRRPPPPVVEPFGDPNVPTQFRNLQRGGRPEAEPLDPLQRGPGRRPQPRPDLPEWAEMRIDLPPRLQRDDSKPYYIVWQANGDVVKQQDAPESPPNRASVNESHLERHRSFRQHRGPFREVFIRGPRQSLICVGRPVEREKERATSFALFIGLVGVGFFSVAMLGGWWSMNRTLAPLDSMTQTANAISTQSLNQRLDLVGFDNELNALGSVLNKMLDRLEEGFEQQRQFAADASHELRTPLSVILNSTELALSRDRTADAYRTELERCHRAAVRMRELVDALLTLARVEVTGTGQSFGQVDLMMICQEQVEFVRPLADELHVYFQCEWKNCSVIGDAGLLGLLVSNLLTNAIKYNNVEGKVIVSLCSDGKLARLSIADTGIGIPQNEIPHIFERFYRVDKARSRKTGGSGLGLAIAAQIVKRHHGTIEVHSHEGQGTTITVNLPISHSTLSENSARQQKESSDGRQDQDGNVERTLRDPFQNTSSHQQPN